VGVAAVRGVFLLTLLAGPALAADPSAVEQARLVELDRARAEVADQIHLAAFDLVDELVYGWMTEPVFERPTAVVLAGVSVPAGLGSGMQALLENHISAVLIHNPSTNVQLVHCPTCTAVVVHSGPEGTVVSRGYDNPRALAELGDGTGKHALFIDVEAEGAGLVLRARLTRLTPELPVVWSHTIASATSAPALLRQPEDLKSVAEARQEYLDVLRGRGNVDIPVRLVVRTYARGDNTNSVAAPPFLWLQTGVELGATEARAWTSSLLVGYSFIPQAYQGISGQARINRLLTGRSRSLSRPDLYGFVGAAAVTVWGTATGAFREEILTVDEVITDLEEGESPRTTFGTLQLGLDLRLGNRVGMSTYIETLPSLQRSANLGQYVTLAGIRFQTFGTEVSFWF